MATYLVDIDGTLANVDHRRWSVDKTLGHKPNWELFFQLMINDEPYAHMQKLLSCLATCPNTNIVYVTGRPERFRVPTARWLEEHHFPYGHSLHMRPDGDRRDDHVIKYEILQRIINHYGLKPDMAFDDRDSVVHMWRVQGIPCAQVREGKF